MGPARVIWRVRAISAGGSIIYHDFVRSMGRYGHSKTIALLAVVALGAGVLTAAATLPFVGVAGIATRDTARTFNSMRVAGLWQLPSRAKLVDSHAHPIAYVY